MKGFGIEIKNTLLDQKHVDAMGVAVWLYMWLIDKVTSVSEDGIGIVLGGRPVKYEEVKAELGISADTYSRWSATLAAYPYIVAVRVPDGIVYKVLKTHKHFGKRFRISAESDSAEVRAGFRRSAVSPHIDNISTVQEDRKPPEAAGEAPDISYEECDDDGNPIKGKKPKVRVTNPDGTFGKPSINEILAYARDALAVSRLDGGEAVNRKYAQILLNSYKTIEAVRGIISAAANDDFHSKNATGLKYIYYNAEKILKSRRPEVLDPVSERQAAAIRACGKCVYGMIEVKKDGKITMVRCDCAKNL